MNIKNIFKTCLLATICMSIPIDNVCANGTNLGAEPNDTVHTEAGKDDRNVMLNASDANKPREIQIGLPGEDVNVYENGLPVVYSSAVHKLASHWRSTAALGSVGLLTPSESAITTGNIAYSVNALSHLGQREFKGTINYKTNHFGLQAFDLNVSGGVGNRWLYSASAYQNFDPGTFKVRIEDFADRTGIYQAAVTRLLNNGRGKVSLLYKYAESRNAGNYLNAAPFIYVGNGAVKELPGFALGTMSYGPKNGDITYMDIMTGKTTSANLRDHVSNKSHEASLLADYTFGNGTKLNFNMKYMNAPKADYVDFGGSTISEVSLSDGYTKADGTPYEGLVEGRRTWLHFGKVSNFLMTTELSRRINKHALRLGINTWHYRLNYHSSSLQWTGSVQEYPEILTAADGTRFRGYNELSPEYTKGTENKVAMYLTDDWQLSRKLNLYLGGRMEYYRMSADQIPYARYEGFHIGDRHVYTTDEGKEYSVLIEPHKVTKNKLNYAATTRLTYNITDNFGITADATVATRFPRINEYAGTGPTEEQYKRVTIPLLRGGVFYRNAWLNLTSMVTYISKSNNIDQQNLTRPGSTESKTTLLIYGIRTLGWTTSAEADPFKGFHLHALLTLQKPEYTDYNASVTFSDGSKAQLNANGNIVKEIPQVLIELDPSYQATKDLRLWLSFRYFGKTYANLTDALYFNGRWETFGGITWQANKHITLGCTVVNFLNQKGASGTINGAELITKDEAGKFANHYMSGSYIRPFTMEFTAGIKF